MKILSLSWVFDFFTFPNPVNYQTLKVLEAPEVLEILEGSSSVLNVLEEASRRRLKNLMKTYIINIRCHLLI